MQPVLEGTVHGHLQRVVARPRRGREHVDGRGARLGEQLTVGVAAGLGVVQVLGSRTAVGARADVAHADRDVQRQAAFDERVPRLRGARASTSFGIGRRHVHAPRQRNVAAREVRVWRAGDALGHIAVGDEAVQAGVAVGDRQREPPTHRARPRQRGERPAVAGAEHRALVETVRGADARREERLADVDAQILRVAAEAAEPDVERVDVEQLDAAVLTGHQRVVLVAEAKVQRELLVDLPAIGHVEAGTGFRGRSAPRTARSCE